MIKLHSTRIILPEGITRLAITENKQSLGYINEQGDSVFLWDLKELTYRKFESVQRLKIMTKIQISPNNQYMAVSGYSPQIDLWNLSQENPTPLALTQKGLKVESFRFSSSSNELSVIGKYLQIWNCSDGTLLKQFTLDSFLISRLTENFVFLRNSQFIRQINRNSGKHVRRLLSKQDRFTQLYGNDQFIAINYYQQLKIFAVRGGKQVRRINLSQKGCSLIDNNNCSYSIKTLRFASKLNNHSVSLYCMSSLIEIQTWSIQEAIQFIHLRDDGSCIYIVTDKQILRYAIQK